MENNVKIKEWYPLEKQHHTKPQMVEYEGVLVLNVYMWKGISVAVRIAVCVCVSEGERGVIHGQALMGAPIPCHYSDPSSPQTLFKPQSALSSVIPLEYICMGGSEIELCHVQANSIITLSKRARWSQTPYWLTPKYINPALHLVHLTPLLSITCLAPHSIYCLFSHWQLG